MNYFYCDTDPQRAAQALDDRRLTKMVLETAQLLNNVLAHHGDPTAPYKPTHMNHPSSVWARTSVSNYQQMLAYFAHIANEFTYRTGKDHKCYDHYHTFVMFTWDINPDDWDKPYGTPVPNCTDFKDVGNVVEAYRLHLAAKWQAEIYKHQLGNWYKPVWTKRTPPQWFVPQFYDADTVEQLTKINDTINRSTGA